MKKTTNGMLPSKYVNMFSSIQKIKTHKESTIDGAERRLTSSANDKKARGAQKHIGRDVWNLKI